MLGTVSYKLPQGGFSLGIIKILLLIATKPEHVRVAQQGLTLMQTKDTDFKISEEIQTLVCKTAAKLGAQEIGLSFLQAPWFNYKPNLKSFEILLEKYVQQAEEWYLDRLVEGLEPEHQQRYLYSVPKKEKKLEPEKKEKIIEKSTDVWLTSFTNTYRELISARHEWSPDAKAYSLIVSFYACIGDVDNALKIKEDCKKPMTSPALSRIMLSLIYHNRAQEALKYYEDEPTKSLTIKGAIAAYLALGNEEKVKELYKDRLEHFKEKLDEKYLKVHFGNRQRKDTIVKIFRELESSQPLTENVQNYLKKIEA